MFLKSIILTFSIILLHSCNSGGDKEKSKNENSKKSLTIQGTVSFISSQLFVGSAFAADTSCKSVCNRQTQQCAALFKLATNPSDKDEKICDTEIKSDGTYKFEIDNQEALEDEALLIRVDNFKGNKREGVVVVDDNNIQKDIDPTATASATSLKEEVRNNGRIDNSEVENHKNLLQNELILMCPLVITPSNVKFVIKNTINILSRDRSVPLFLLHRNLLSDGLPLDPIRSDLDNYCNLVSTIISSQNSTNLKVRLVDKKGNPYGNMQMYIGENNINGSIYTTSGNGVFKTTDADGYFDVSGLSVGGHSLIIGDYSWYTTNFLWTEDEKYIGYFDYNSNLFYQEVVFPRVLKSEPAVDAPNFRPSHQERFFARSFSLSSSLDFCGIGTGFGLGNTGRPNRYQIRPDLNNAPADTVLYESKVYGFTGALSQGGEGPFSNFCTSYTNVHLEAGTFWVVAVYDTSPEVIAIFGSNSATANGLPILSSVNGLTWNDAEINVVSGGVGKKWNSSFFFITE